MTDVGRTIPAFPACGYDIPQSLKSFRNSLGAALAKAQDSIKTGQTAVADAVTSLNTVLGTVDKILATNPDPTTPNSTKSLMASLGGLYPTAESDAIEDQIGKVFDLNVVNGVLIPKGTAKLTELRRLFKALCLNKDHCSFPDFNQDFLFATTYNKTEEVVTGNSCDRETIAYTVTEQCIGLNIPIATAAKAVGIAESDVLIRFFWVKTIKRDVATQKRLKALGLSGDDLSNVVMAPKNVGRVYSAVVDPATVAALQKMGLEDWEICQLMNRTDTRSGINLAPTANDAMRAVTDVLNKNTSSNRSRAGTDTHAITPSDNTVAPAADKGDPVTMLLAVLNIPRTMRIKALPDGTVQVDDLIFDVNAVSDDRCKALLMLIFDAIAAIQTLAQQGLDIFLALLALALGVKTLSTGMEFSTCLASIGLGLNLSLDLAIGLPFQMQAFLAVFAAALAAIVAVVLGFKAVLCIPEGLIQLLFGGICGFKPFDFNMCPPPPDLTTLVDRLASLINMVSLFISSLIGALQVMKIDVSADYDLSLQLKVFSACALAVIPVGIALGLAGDLKIEATVTAELPGVGNVSASGGITPAGELTGAVSGGTPFGGGLKGSTSGTTG